MKSAVTSVSIGIGVMTSALWFYWLDILGVDVWAAERIGHFIHLVIEASK